MITSKKSEHKKSWSFVIMVEENINRFILIKSKMKLQLVFISSFLFFANNHLPAYSSFYRDQLNPTCLEKYGTNECVKIATVSAFCKMMELASSQSEDKQKIIYDRSYYGYIRKVGLTPFSNEVIKAEKLIDNQELKKEISLKCEKEQSSFLSSTRSINKSAKNQSSSIDPCLNARDYEGCKRANNTYTVTPIKKNNDFLGRPKIPNWVMNEIPEKNTVIYQNPEIKKVKVRGLYGRYFLIESVVRIYQEPQQGSPGSSHTIGSYNTSCTGGTYSNYINCSTTTPTTINIPGRASIPGGIRQRHLENIVDCYKGTRGTYINNKLVGKWKAINGTFYESWAKEVCSKISTLREANFSKLEKGNANRTDIEAIKFLPGQDYSSIRRNHSR